MKLIQKLFYIFSISLLSLFIVFYLSRAIYYKIQNDKRRNYSNILYERILQQEKNYTLISELENINDNYYYTNKSKYNYVYYKGLTWRIIKFNEQNITLILDNSITNLPIDKVDYWLNYYNKKDSGIFYKLINTEINVHNLNNSDKDVHIFMNNGTLYCDYMIDKITLLDINDYNNAGGEKSYLNNNTDFWIKDKEEFKYIDSTGELIEDTTQFHNVRPVITLNSSLNAYEGNGSIDDPYNIYTPKIDVLSKIENSSYLKYNDTLWKVLSNDGKNIKIVSEDCLKDNEDKCVNLPYSNVNNEISVYNSSSVIYYLNHTYYNNLNNKEYINPGYYYIGNYTDNNYSTIYTNTIKLNVGLLTISDPYAYELDNVFLLTTNPSSNVSIYISQDEHAFETLVTEKAYIRPTLYLKGNIAIKDGNGTYKDPYELGGLINE